ncbi:MAG: hypothetical protein HY342_12985 [Candidatus Lambdaproteobacteria bacterium]|nr:hypothetical protein [Candidatus Lambdaproteobacteria bacterium]
MLLGLALSFTSGCSKKSDTTGIATNGTEGATYVGSEACKECHEEVYNGWLTTFHAYKFRTASPDFVIADFERAKPLKDGGAQTSVSRKGDEFFITTTGPQGQLATYKVDYVVGSIWKQRYVTKFPNGALQVLPVQWNVDAKEWTVYHGLDEFKPGETGFWADNDQSFQTQCMGCHTTNSQINYDAATNTYKTTWTRMGVGCEACHGPGSRHVRADIPDKYTSIINPSTMPDPRRASMICGSCHTRGMSVDGKTAYPVNYTPGDQLNFLFDQNPGTYPDRSPKEHHQQYDDWANSGHAAAGVMCWDCHSPHLRGKSNRFQLKLPGSLLCETCHKIQPQGVHGLHSVNNCIGCHMPNTIKSASQGDLRSHTFVVSRPILTVKSGDAKKQPNSCNLCHYHKDYEPERLVHFLRAVKKPDTCKQCHEHQDEDLDDDNY